MPADLSPTEPPLLAQNSHDLCLSTHSVPTGRPAWHLWGPYPLASHSLTPGLFLSWDKQKVGVWSGDPWDTPGFHPELGAWGAQNK